MRVLITNNCLNYRGGAESFVRDLAHGLQNRGHSVVAYSSDLRRAERFLESDLVPVAADLENLPFQPDIIHAQHHLDAMTALMALPGVPALYHCHGAVWRECAPKHPRIYRYLAMSQTLAERMSVESNIPTSDISVVCNGVDLQRFHRVRTLPAQPRRALFFNRVHRRDDETVAAVTAAAGRLGLELDFIGRHFGRQVDYPENILPEYDIVFASGISALEALASGCALVVLGRSSCGEMVCPDNFERFRQVNFSAPANAPPPSVEAVESELRRYAPEECAQVTERLRREADFRPLVLGLEEIYNQVIARHQSTIPDTRAESVAISRYLRRIVPLIKMTDEVQKQDGMPAMAVHALHELRESLATFQGELHQTQKALDEVAQRRALP